jgi:hypothetical protein
VPDIIAPDANAGAGRWLCLRTDGANSNQASVITVDSTQALRVRKHGLTKATLNIDTTNGSVSIGADGVSSSDTELEVHDYSEAARFDLISAGTAYNTAFIRLADETDGIIWEINHRGASDTPNNNKFLISHSIDNGSTWTFPLTIDTSDKVGFGTISPSTRFHIQDSSSIILRIESTGTDSDSSIELKNDAQTWSLITRGSSSDVFAIMDGNTSYRPFQIEPSAPADSFYIDSSGKVGIGTSTPSATLDVGGGTATNIDGIDDLLVKDDADINGSVYIGSPAVQNANGRLKIADAPLDTGYGWNQLTSSSTSGESGMVELRLSPDVNVSQGSSEYDKKMTAVGNYLSYDVEGDVIMSKGVDLYRTKAFRTGGTDLGTVGVIYGHNMAMGHDTSDPLITTGMIGYAFTPFLGGGSSHEMTAFTIERDHAPHGNTVTHIGKCDQATPSPWDTYAPYWNSYELCTGTGYCTNASGDLDTSYTTSSACTSAGGTWHSKSAGNWTEIPPQGFANWFEWSRNYMYGQYLFGNFWGRYGNGVADEYDSQNDLVEFGFSDQIDKAESCYVYAASAVPSSHYIDILTDDANLNGKVIYMWATKSGTEYYETVTITGTTEATQESNLISDLNDVLVVPSQCYSASASGGKVAITEGTGCTINAIAIDYSDPQVTRSNIDIPHYPKVVYGDGSCDFYNVMTIQDKDAIRIGDGSVSPKTYDDDLYTGKTFITTVQYVPPVNGLDLLFLKQGYDIAQTATYGDTSTYDTKMYRSKSDLFLVQDNARQKFIEVNNHGNITLAGSGNGSVTIGNHSSSPMSRSENGNLLIGDKFYMNGASTSEKTIYMTRDGSSTDRARILFTDSATGDSVAIRHDTGGFGTFAFDRNGNFSFDITTVPMLSGATRNFTAREGTPPTGWAGAGNTSRASLWVDDIDEDGAGSADDGTASWFFTTEKAVNYRNFRVPGVIIKNATCEDPTTNNYYLPGDICIDTANGTISMLTVDSDSRQWVTIGNWTP